MNLNDYVTRLDAVLNGFTAAGTAIEMVLLLAAIVLLAVALVPPLARWRRPALAAMTALLLLGEAWIVWFHWQLHQAAVVIDPSTGQVAARVAVPLWIESEKLYVWALVVAVLGLLARRQREHLVTGAAIGVGVLTVGATLWGHPFSDPLPGFLGQYTGYVQAMFAGGAAATQAYEGMVSAVRYYYNTAYMWVHPPLLFFSYGCFTLSFIATIDMLRYRHSSFETTAYRWARLGYLAITFGMLLGFPWAVMAWRGEAWWWSGKVNMSIMLWMLYTAYLHARLYLRRAGMWKLVAFLAILAFLVLVLTYLATYVVPGAHSYA